MKLYEIEILHSIRGRVRLRFSYALTDVSGAYKVAVARVGWQRWSYNPRLRSLTIRYGGGLTLADVMLGVTQAVARGHKSCYVKLTDHRKPSERRITPSGEISLFLVLLNMGIQWVAPTAGIANLAQWGAFASTAGAIVEHGYRELNERGSFDPEVMSIIYMFDAMNKGKMTYAPAISWILTFGRHLLQKSEDSLLLRLEKRQGEIPGRYLYTMEVMDRRHSKAGLNNIKEAVTRCNLAENREASASLYLAN